MTGGQKQSSIKNSSSGRVAAPRGKMPCNGKALGEEAKESRGKAGKTGQKQRKSAAFAAATGNRRLTDIWNAAELRSRRPAAWGPI